MEPCRAGVQTGQVATPPSLEGWPHSLLLDAAPTVVQDGNKLRIRNGWAVVAGTWPGLVLFG